MTATIATIDDFGGLRISDNQTIPGYTEHKPTIHELEKKDFERIMSLTAVQIMSRHKRPVVIEREFRVRIKMPDGKHQFFHINSLKIRNVENRVVQFFWMPTKNEGFNENVNNTQTINMDMAGKLKRIRNIFEDRPITNLK